MAANVSQSQHTTCTAEDTLSGDLVRCLAVDQKVTGIAVSKDGLKLATVSSHLAFVWGALQFRLLAQLNKRGQIAHRKRIVLCRFTCDDLHLITVCSAHLIAVWKVDTRVLLHTMKGHRDKIFDACFSRDGILLHTCSADGTVISWNWRQGVNEKSFVHEYNSIRSLAIHPSFQRLALALANGGAAVWDTNNESRLFEVAPDEKWLKSHNAATRAGAMDPEASHSGPLTCVTFSPDGTLLATCSSDGTCKVWSALSLRADQSTIDNQTRAMRKKSATVSISERQRVQLQGDEAPLTVGYHVSILHTLEHEAEVSRAFFTSDGSFIVTVSQDTTCRIWRLAPNTDVDGSLAFQINLPHAANDIVLTSGWADIASYRLVVAVKNRVLVFDISSEQIGVAFEAPHFVNKRLGTELSTKHEWPPPSIVSPASSSSVASNTHNWQHVFEHGLSRTVIKRGIAHQDLNCQAVLAILMSNSTHAKPTVISLNMARHQLKPKHILALISDLPNFSCEDVLSIISSTNEMSERVFEDIAAGKRVDKHMLEMGFSQCAPTDWLMSVTKLQAKDCFFDSRIKSFPSIPLSFASASNRAFNTASAEPNHMPKHGTTVPQHSRAHVGNSQTLSTIALNMASEKSTQTTYVSKAPISDAEINALREKGYTKIGGNASGFHSPRGLSAQGILSARKIHVVDELSERALRSHSVEQYSNVRQREVPPLQRQVEVSQLDEKAIDEIYLDSLIYLSKHHNNDDKNDERLTTSTKQFLRCRRKPNTSNMKPLLLNANTSFEPPLSLRAENEARAFSPRTGACSCDVRTRRSTVLSPTKEITKDADTIDISMKSSSRITPFDVGQRSTRAAGAYSTDMRHRYRSGARSALSRASAAPGIMLNPDYLSTAWLTHEAQTTTERHSALSRRLSVYSSRIPIMRPLLYAGALNANQLQRKLVEQSNSNRNHNVIDSN